MKRVLVITSQSGKTVNWLDRKKYVNDFCEDVTKKSGGQVSVVFTTYKELDFSIKKGEASIYDHKNKRALADFDFVHFKNWTHEMDIAGLTARYLSKHDIPFANPEVVDLPSMGKISQAFRFADQSIPTPDTLLLSPERAMLAFKSQDVITEGFSFPLIVKSNDGAKGSDNYLVHTVEEMQEIYENNADIDFVIQNFVPNKGDLRILYVGTNNAPLVFERRATKDSGHLNNTSKGGTGNLLSYSDLSIDIKRDAHNAATVLKREICGVDVIIDANTNEHYILEVNATPALATGYGKAEKINLFLDYVLNDVKTKEEE